GLKSRHRSGGVQLGIERQRGLVSGVAAPVGITRFLFLNVSRIRQHERAQIPRSRSAEDSALKSATNEPRQVTTMIEGCMSKDYGVDSFRIDRQRGPVPLAGHLEGVEIAAS